MKLDFICKLSIFRVVSCDSSRVLCLHDDVTYVVLISIEWCWDEERLRQTHDHPGVGEGEWSGGSPCNRLFSNVQLLIIPAVINHHSLTNELQQSGALPSQQQQTYHNNSIKFQQSVEARFPRLFLFDDPALKPGCWLHDYFILTDISH